MPVPLIKRGANQAGYPGKKLPAWPPSQGAVSGPDKPCRMIPFRRTPEGGGGGREVFWCQQTSPIPYSRLLNAKNCIFAIFK